MTKRNYTLILLSSFSLGATFWKWKKQSSCLQKWSIFSWLNNRRFYLTDSYTFKDNKLQLKKIDESVQITFAVFLKSIIFAFVSWQWNSTTKSAVTWRRLDCRRDIWNHRFLTYSPHLANFRLLHLRSQCLVPGKPYGNFMILELLLFVQSTEPELQTETDIGRQKIMQFPQLLLHKHARVLYWMTPWFSKIPDTLKLGRALRYVGILSGFFLCKGPLWDRTSACHAWSHISVFMHGRVFISLHFEHLCWKWLFV